jgi:hypothetical protein
MPSDGSSPSLPPPSSPSSPSASSPPPSPPPSGRPAQATQPTKASPAGRRPGRPWYLVVALLGAWFFGSNAALVGWERLSLFQTGTEQVEPAASEGTVDEDRLHAQRERLDDAVYAARRRVLPLAAASLLLGVSLWIFAVGAMAGRPGARVLLCQLVAAHAALGVLFYLLTPDVRRVEGDVARETIDIAAHAALDGGTVDARTQQALALTGEAVGVWQVVLQAGDLVLHGAVLLALTRRRTRAFYDLARG